MNKVKVLITGAGSGVGQSIIKSLRMSNIPVEIIGTDMQELNPGLFLCDKGYIIPSAFHEQYIDHILTIIQNEKPRLLYPGTDKELPVLAAIKDQIEALGCFLVAGSNESVQLVRNKLECSIFYSKRPLPFVKTVYLRDVNQLIQSCGFPILVKPFDGSGSQGVYVLFSEEELSRLTLDESEYIAQEFIIPEDWNKQKHQLTKNDVFKGGILNQKDEYSIQIIVGKEYEILGCFISKNELRAGYPLKIYPIKNRELESVAIEMVMELVKIGMVGPVNLQCRITKNGPVFFEINPRFTGITGMRAGMGFNECEVMIRHFVFDESADACRSVLDYEPGWVCARYMTEILIREDEVLQLKQTGFTNAKGRTLSL